MTRSTKPSGSDRKEIEELGRMRRRMVAQLFVASTQGVTDLQEVFGFTGNTVWEELTCVGFHPQTSKLLAVVEIKQPFGYSGNLCSQGSTEYVRFFVDWKDGAGFQDVGLASFKVYDISGSPPGPQHPFCHVVELELSDDDRRRCCSTAVLPEVRAVLSWNHIPSADPHAVPAFGNARDAHVQLAPDFADCLTPILAKTPALASIDVAGLVLEAKPAPAAWSDLVRSYRQADVGDERLVYDVVAPMVTGALAPTLAAYQPDLALVAKLDIDLEAIIDQLVAQQPGDANTSFEELVCVGLNTATDTVGGVIRIKRPFGYAGNLCQTGSKEYVAFWADWDNNGTYDEYLGTAAVDVHDLGTIPGDGVFYAVTMPVDLASRVRGCDNPNMVRIRGVLSWAVPPSTTDPQALNFYGNREDCVVRIRHGVGGTGLLDLLYSVGNVGVDQIHPTTHLAYPSGGVFPAGCSGGATDRPFAGRVDVRGRIYNSGAPGNVHYQVQVKPKFGGTWTPAMTKVTYKLAHPDPADPLFPFEHKTVEKADGWFPYQEDWTASPPILEAAAFLGAWQTAGLQGPYMVRLAYSDAYPALPPGSIHYSDVVVVRLDNTGFVVSQTPNTSVDTSSTLDLVVDGGDCHQYEKGAVINGHLRVLDTHFHRWNLELQPTTHTHGTQASPACRSVASLADSGDGNAAWTLDTEDLDPCGYTLTLWGRDRAIVDSNGALMHVAKKAVGFSVV